FVDDFELGFKTYREAEECLIELNHLLRDAELEINQLKTEIVKLPAPLESKWLQDIRRFDLNDQRNPNYQKRILLNYFDETLTCLQANAQEHVLNYALSKLTPIEVFPDNYKILQNFLFHCLMLDTSAFLRVLTILQNIFPHELVTGINEFD